MDSKTFIGIGLMMLVYFVFLMPKPPEPGSIDETKIAQKQESSNATRDRAVSSSKPATRTETKSNVREADLDSSVIAEARSKVFRLVSKRLVLVTNGLGEISEIVLPSYSVEPNSEEPVRFFFAPDHPFNRSLVKTSSSPFVWTKAEKAGNGISLRAKNAEGLVLTREIELAPDGTYSLRYKDVIENTGDRSQTISLFVEMQKEPSPKKESGGFFLSLFTGPPVVDTAIWYTDESLDFENLASIEADGEIQKIDTSSAWAGFSDKYFFKGFVPKTFAIDEIQLKKQTGQNNDTGEIVYQEIENPSLQVPPGETRNLEYSFYLGPKKIPELQKLTKSLGRAVDYGDWIGPISRFLLLILLFFHSLIPNYGIAIILLTLSVKTVLFPLAWKATYSMRKLATVQPLMKEIQTKYKKDPQRLQAEMMALYKREKVNPLGGCFPILLQMPVFFALYKLFFASFEMRHAPFFGWIQDLSAYDPLFITPVAMVILMYFQQKLTPMPTAGGEETEAMKIQKKLIKWMPFMFGAIMIFLPAGLTLYFLVNAGVSVLQQYFMNKRLDKILPRPSNEVLKAANGN